MNVPSYSIHSIVDQTPEETFNAISRVYEWWTGKPGVNGDSLKVGDVFTYQYEDIHYSKQKVVEMIPYGKLLMQNFLLLMILTNGKVQKLPLRFLKKIRKHK